MTQRVEPSLCLKETGENEMQREKAVSEYQINTEEATPVVQVREEEDFVNYCDQGRSTP